MTGVQTCALPISWINEGLQILYEKLTEAYGEDYVESTAALTTVAGTSDYALPDDFFKLIGIDLNIYGAIRTLKPYTNQERNTLRQAIPSYITIPRYRIVGGFLRLLPATISTTGTLFYLPMMPRLTDPSDAVDFPNGWERYVVMYAAIQCRIKEESDCREMMTFLQKWDAELASIVEERDLAAPKHAVDIENIDVVRIL